MSIASSGYFRFPTLNKDRIIFVSEDDLWQVSAGGGSAHRLTSNPGLISHPHFSPDGNLLAFAGRDEGITEIYVMPSDGGVAKRLTYMGSISYVIGWKENKIIFGSSHSKPFPGMIELYLVDPETAEIEKLPYGPANHISFGAKGIVIGRDTGDPARWKRYRGGRAGKFWVDASGSGKFRHLKSLKGNLTSPMWIGERIYFISDQDGFGNIYSCRSDGKMLKQHTNHREYYCRNASTDGQRITYQNGADIYIYDLKTEEDKSIDIQFASPQVQVKPKFVPAERYLDDYALNNDGGSIAVISRGKAFTFGDWEGPVRQHGNRQGVRYRLLDWLEDGRSFVTFSDEGGRDHIEIHDVKGEEPVKSLNDLDLGRPIIVKAAPKGKSLCLINHRNELIYVDLEKESAVIIEQDKFAFVPGFSWSPDAAWIAFSIHISPQQSVIKIFNIESGESTQVTEPILIDSMPTFDPEGKYLYFISSRIFNPVYDNIHFDYNFPQGERPYLITLKKDLVSPFVPEVKGFGAPGTNGNDDKKKDDTKDEKGEKDKEADDTEKTDAPDIKVEIDFEGIRERVVAFPVAEGLYSGLAAIKDRVFYTTYPIEGTLGRDWASVTPDAKGTLKVYEFSKLEENVFVAGISNFMISANGAALAYRKGNKLRVIDAKREPKLELPKEDKPNRKTGWIDLNRMKIAIDPRQEWRQMYAEAWRLQRDYFWVENMSDIDWKKIYDRYLPLIDRLGSRSEFSDLLWEMQGELGTSHAYEMGGDYRPHPNYMIGLLGAELEYNRDRDVYSIKHIAAGDTWNLAVPPPLKRPGVNITEGMLLLGVGGEPVNGENPPYKALLNQAGQEVQLEVANADGEEKRMVVVKTLRDETSLWYRDWVESNRRYVHEKSKGKVGYVHIPNMSPVGYAEFHRYFLAELGHEGLVIDVRFNGGGHVSPLLLEKLARKHFGYYRTRWMGEEPKPAESPRGPMVALTNEGAGSDGDIFSHGFKFLKLGKLIGTRTWGGVVGIWPRNSLADGTLTTQPEFSNWFFDVGYGVENYGTDPDIEVEIAPQDFAAGKDPQLDRAIQETLKEIKENPPISPDLSKDLPKLTLPE